MRDQRNAEDICDRLCYLASCVVAGEASVGLVRRMRPKVRPRQIKVTPNSATKPMDDAHRPIFTLVDAAVPMPNT